jgi:hypothetical protein
VIRMLAASCAVLLTTGALGAHGLDEYVQAMRVAVAMDSVVVHIGLTPGVAVAPAIIEHVDRDGDGLISPAEAEAYGRDVLNDLTLTSDGAPVVLGLTRVDAPPPGELRDGIGTIRIETFARIPATAGARKIVLHNRHRPSQSVYLANALLPESDAITIQRQERNANQQLFRLDYEVAQQRTGGAMWLVVAAALLLLHVRWRARRPIATLS